MSVIDPKAIAKVFDGFAASLAEAQAKVSPLTDAQTAALFEEFRARAATDTHAVTVKRATLRSLMADCPACDPEDADGIEADELDAWIASHVRDPVADFLAEQKKVEYLLGEIVKLQRRVAELEGR